ncbi:MarR family winged helix-turn-helix transcriptional regulator [Actinophytocola oryzae]|uniref:DNA-binding MarR family transcriptional regulator n=1 Tax=Actinophytocola oryzae TaxID=502181 RepID=A0A4R7VIH1_9PSEU|nr:MarR family winged helix-turn-helix transcriptional regulator [Actinophytocola oryzae]TDV48995.1 DNA-binding MarR family transcriptional regulator [Actinophytocola oryzae]
MERTNVVRELNRATFVLVSEAQRGMAKAFDAPRVGVLRMVADGPLRPSEIGERLDMAPSSVTRHVQALEDAGHVTVEADPFDARTCLVEVTEDGTEELDRLESLGLAAFEQVVADWDADDLVTLTRLLARLTRDWAERGTAARRPARPGKAPRWRFRPREQPAHQPAGQPHEHEGKP